MGDRRGTCQTSNRQQSSKTLEIKRERNVSAQSNQMKQAESRANLIRARSRQLTLSLFCLTGSISCLAPFLSLHMTNRIGLLLFESKVLQLRSTCFTAIICLLVLVILGLTIFISSDFRSRSLLLQKVLRISSGALGITSILAYLSLALIVPHIKQAQRMPLAAFDCQANEISIENCPQQFATSNIFAEDNFGLADVLVRPLKQLLVGDLNGNSERLITKLDCLRYNRRDLRALRVPTRFLLHKCGLVCKPQRQQLHQFSDDLNSSTNNNNNNNNEDHSEAAGQQNSANSLGANQTKRPLVAPYSHEALASDGDASDFNNLVSLKICFSGEVEGLAGGGGSAGGGSIGSNYKKFCIENLTNEGGSTTDEQTELAQESAQSAKSIGETVTLGQLNALLSKITSDQRATTRETRSGAGLQADQLGASTHYVNPIVQFESHFKNWPHLKSRPDEPVVANVEQNTATRPRLSVANNWCRFKPIPPFIVNNKPFSDVQCSLEHEYLIRTSRGSKANATGERIYLRRSSLSVNNHQDEHQVGSSRERCTIQCKVNILYQVNLVSESLKSSTKSRKFIENTSGQKSFYLPLKPCLFSVGSGDKATTAKYYLIFRCVADSSLLLAFILVDLLLLVESIDTNLFHLEGKKLRLFSLGVAFGLLPIIVALMFDLTAVWLPNYVQQGRDEGYLVSFVKEHFVPALSNLLSSLYTSLYGQSRVVNNDNNSSPASVIAGENSYGNVDNYLVPFFIYALLMFTFALRILRLPLVDSIAVPLVRPVSTEELGLVTSKGSNSQREAKGSLNNCLSRRRSVLFFSVLTLFMGLQFNLSQITQTSILLESFELKQQESSGKLSSTNGAAFWFVLATQSSGSLFILLVAMMFSDELSAFLADFSPLKSTTTSAQQTNVALNRRRSEAKFMAYLSISLIIYAVRYFVLVNLIQANSMRWPLVFLFQITELLNFPLTWFVLTSRAHKLILEHPKLIGLQSGSDLNSRLVNVHSLVQSLLAFVYFVLARFFAMLLHTMHAHLHLHSDNIDWFIEIFYKDNLERAQPLSPAEAQQQSAALKNVSVENKQEARTGNHSAAAAAALFSPLPSERQTYLHASRLFAKYNSLACLILGLSLSLAFVYLKHQLWLEERRQSVQIERELERERAVGSEQRLIDERLSLDLGHIHRKPKQLTTVERPAADTRPLSQAPIERADKDEGPRARIHFRYDVGRHQRKTPAESSSLSSENDAKLLHRTIQPPPPLKFAGPESKSSSCSSSELAEARKSPPAKRRAELLASRKHQRNREIEQVTITRSKRIQLVEDGEHWSLDDHESMGTVSPALLLLSPPPAEFADPNCDQPNEGGENKGSHQLGKRISFAPTATLLGHDGQMRIRRAEGKDKIDTSALAAATASSGSSSSSCARRASPEPSIDDEKDAEEEENFDADEVGSEMHLGEADSIESVARRFK